ncbi:hypothetical protein CC80DRAFT_515116 [Byssothecium circinans]|uniref:DNA recombination and repair protein Rad51-like C-terminal domain-containing protein n=1 Tax=Byssothecium circinans TaxID=147558 RepID=A0A6A5U214_9PLEO|nr:hypothetical protein CC80DRAFT_515116 [Byssothecium circinans]
MERAGGTASPAEALLAASFVGDEVLESLFNGVVNGAVGKKGREGRLGVGVKSVDEALEGAVGEGRVVGVSCEVGGAGVEVCLTLLANSLLEKPASVAAVVDTTGNLDVLRLYTIILSRLHADATLLGSLRMVSGQDGSAEDVAAKVLDRVKIMRAFDLVGVMEAVNEIRDGLEGRMGLVVSEKEKEVVETDTSLAPKKTVIADSEDEDEDEILFETEAAHQTQRESVAPPVRSAAPDPVPEQNPTKMDTRDEDEGKVAIVLIDNLAHVVNPLLKKDYVHTHALTSTFLLTLANLTRTHTLHTILLNPSTIPRPPAPKPPLNPNQGPDPSQPQQQYQPPPPPSIFASSKLVPALGNVLAPYLDLHLLVERMPRRKADARVLYAEGGTAGKRSVRGGKGPEMVGVVEVLSDRWSGRVGAWGVFGEGEKGMQDL